MAHQRCRRYLKIFIVFVALEYCPIYNKVFSAFHQILGASEILFQQNVFFQQISISRPSVRLFQWIIESFMKSWRLGRRKMKKNVKVIFQIPSVIWKSISQLNGTHFDNDLAWMQGPMAAEIARFMSLWLICSANAVFKEFRRVHGILSTELNISAQNMHLCKSRPKIKYYDWFWWEKDIPV